jgi:hypothetical protein
LSLNTATAIGALREPGEKTKCVMPLAANISTSAFTIGLVEITGLKVNISE